MCGCGEQRSGSRPRDAVTAFAFVADPRNEPRWNPAAIGVEDLAPVPITSGTRCVVVGRTMSREMRVSLEIVEHKPPRHIRTLGSSGPMRFDTTFEIEPAGVAASVTMSVAVTAVGAARIVAPVLRAGFSRRLAKLASRLERAIEAGASAGGT